MNALSDRRPAAAPRPAFSHVIEVDDVPDEGLALTIAAAPEDCAAIALQLDLPAVASLSVRYRIARRPAGRLHVEGELAADITQVCVVSLDPFAGAVATAIDAVFAPPPRDPSAAAESRRHRGREEARRGPLDVRETAVPAAADDPEAPDPIVDGRIDLGALAVEFLALGLDLYPRKPGVAFADMSIGDQEAPPPSAFAALERLKDRS